MTLALTHKRGDTLVLTGEARVDGKPVDVTFWKIRSQVRKGRELVETLTVTKVPEFTGVYQVSSANDTQTWPLGDLSFDVEYTNTQGQVISTETVTFRCINKITANDLPEPPVEVTP